MDSSSPVINSSRRASNFVLWLFAAVGFVAAVVQIAQYWWPNSSELKIGAHVQQSLIPQTITTAIKSDFDKPGYVRALLEDDRKDFCSFSLKATASKEEIETAARKCEDVKLGLNILDLIGASSDFKTVTYDLENTGSQIAREVRVSSKDVAEVNAASGSETRRIERKEGEDFYRLPDLNPGEKVAVSVWTNSYGIDPKSEFLSVSDLPKITFSGGKPDITLYRPVPSFYGDLKYFLDIFPLPVAIILVLGICVIISLLVFAFFVAVDALISGKPLSAAFGVTPYKQLPSEVTAE